MIKPVTQKQFSDVKTADRRKTGNGEVNQKPSAVKQYADSFVKHSKESAPMLIAMTAVWSLIDSTGTAASIKKALVRNVKGFFLPVLIASSAVLAGIENKKTNKTEK